MPLLGMQTHNPKKKASIYEAFFRARLGLPGGFKKEAFLRGDC